MTYQQAGYIAVAKRVIGWLLFILALVSTFISLVKFIDSHPQGEPGINAVVLDFAHVMINIFRDGTPFLNVFWQYSPVPDFLHGMNISFWVVFALMFIGLALTDSGARMARQARFIREGITDQLILEQAKGDTGLTRAQLESRVVIPRHTILVQIFPLYILPIIVLAAGYLLLSIGGFLG